MVNIIDKLGEYPIYLSSSYAARTEKVLRDNNITAVVNLAQDLNDPWFGGILPIKIGLTDGSANPQDAYALAATIIHHLLVDGHTILIHCHEGRSRTAAIATLVVSELQSCSLDDAFQYVCKYRPFCAHMEKGHWKNMRPE